MLLEKTNYNNIIKSFTQSDLGKSQSNVSNGLKTLKNNGIIFKNGRYWYFSNDYVKYAGYLKYLQKVIKFNCRKLKGV